MLFDTLIEEGKIALLEKWFFEKAPQDKTPLAHLLVGQKPCHVAPGPEAVYCSSSEEVMERGADFCEVCNEIWAIFEKSPNFHAWMIEGNMPVPVEHDEPCECGEKVVCCYADLGSQDEHCDVYAHVCVSHSCDYIETRIIKFNPPKDRRGVCPLCARKQKKPNYFPASVASLS